MSITTVLFDLDGTLLPMDQETFAKTYIGGLVATAAPLGYDPKTMANAILSGTAAMVKNSGEKSNEAVFWDVLAGIFGESILNDFHIFDEFYKTDFQKIKDVCGFAPEAAEVVQRLKKKGFRVALATNPLFPAVATESRIRWAGLDPREFELYTTYENASHCKPNPDYYRDVLAMLKVAPEECVMVGNDVGEDMIAAQLGMKVFLLTDCIINRKEEDISVYPHGDFHALLAYMESLSAERKESKNRV